MKLVKPSFEIWEQKEGLEGLLKHIEVAGRTCYKSADKITEDSAKGFVERMIKSEHHAMLEHGTVYLKVPRYKWEGMFNHIDDYRENPYSWVCHAFEFDNRDNPDYWAITTNYRVLIENDWLDDLEYLCEPTKSHVRRVTVHFTCDRGVSHEFVRHRVFSFAQESQRYCNYSKDKYSNEVTFCIPCWCNMSENVDYYEHPDEIGKEESEFFRLLNIAENYYFTLLNSGWKPEQARAVLPNATKTELVMTGFVADWKHFFNLRALDATGKAHPSAKELAVPLLEEFKKREYIDQNYGSH